MMVNRERSALENQSGSLLTTPSARPKSQAQNLNAVSMEEALHYKGFRTRPAVVYTFLNFYYKPQVWQWMLLLLDVVVVVVVDTCRFRFIVILYMPGLLPCIFPDNFLRLQLHKTLRHVLRNLIMCDLVFFLDKGFSLWYMQF